MKTVKNRKVPNKRELNAILIMLHTVTMLAKFHLNTYVDSEKGKVNICIEHFGLDVLVVSDLSL